MNLLGTAKYAKKAIGKKVNPESMCSTCTRSRSRIQSTQNKFKVIGFTNSQRGQVAELVGNEEVMAYLTDTPIVFNNNDHLFKNNIEYASTKFMQDSKMTNKSIEIFFNNSD